MNAQLEVTHVPAMQIVLTMLDHIVALVDQDTLVMEQSAKV